LRAIQQSLDDLGPPLVDVEFAVLDVETTGGAPATDRITEVGAVKVRGGEVTGTFQTLVNPGVPIPPMITALTGISDGMVAGSEPIEVVLPSLLEFLGDAVLVAHNASFDTRFLQHNLEVHGYPKLTSQVVCTKRLAQVVLPRDEVPNLKLATLARYLRARTQPCHRAFADAHATVDVLHGLLERAAGFGVLTLNDLLTFPTVRTQQRHSYAKAHLADALPRSPGVYLFRDRRDEVLYVGKTGRDLRARVRSYFSGDGRAKIEEMLEQMVAVDHVVCTGDLEASVHEIRLIQRYRPRYNRRGRDPERTYCYLKLTRERWPRLSVVRKVADDGATYLGPLSSTAQAELVKSAIEDAVPLRRCTRAIGPRTRFAPCALLELRRCAGPCAGLADAEAYTEHVATLTRCLSGGDPEPLLGALRERMRHYADEQRYEQAAGIRDRLEALSRALDDRRRLATLRAAGELVLALPHPRGREVTVLCDGQLVSMTVVPPGEPPLPPGDPRLSPSDATLQPSDPALPSGDPTVVLGDPTPPEGDPALAPATATLFAVRPAAGNAAAGSPDPVTAPPPRHLADEIRLVANWLDQVAGEVELLAVSGTLASPAVGGAALQVRYDPARQRSPLPGEARGRPLLRPRSGRGRPASRAAALPRR
jgi:DNA polymerase-3 subunit epsilon